MFRCAVFETGASGQAVSLPVARILAVVAPTFGARINPDGLSGRDHLRVGVIHVAVGTLLAFRTAFSRLVQRVDTWWRGTICNQTAGNAITVTIALLTFGGLEVLPQLVDHPSVLAADSLAAGAAVCGIVAHMDAGGRQGRALSTCTRRALCRALALGTVVRVQEIPLPDVVNAPVGLTGALLVRVH